MAGRVDWDALHHDLIAFEAAGVSQRAMAARLCVSRSSVRNRLVALGLRRPLSVRTPKQLTLEQVAERIAKLAEMPTEHVCPKRILRQQCAEVFGLTEAELLGRSRKRVMVIPRQLAYFVLKQRFPAMSYPDVARMMGGRDHSTIIYGIRIARWRIKRDPALAAIAAALISPPNDAHVIDWRAHKRAMGLQALAAMQAPEPVTQTVIDELAEARAEACGRLFCGQCDRAVTVASARNCRAVFCKLAFLAEPAPLALRAVS